MDYPEDEGLDYFVKKEGDRVVLKVAGVLDALTSPEIKPTINELVAQNIPHTVIDITDLELIDSSGVGCIISYFKRAKNQGGETYIAGAGVKHDMPRAVFGLLRIDCAIPFYATVEDAIERKNKLNLSRRVDLMEYKPRPPGLVWRLRAYISKYMK